VTASVAGVTNTYADSFSHDGDPGDLFSAPWVNPRLTFVATAETLRVTFDATGHLNGQPNSGSVTVLDDVSIVPGEYLWRITGISISNNFLFVTGTNGPPNTYCDLMTSSDISAPADSWRYIATQVVASDGTVSFSLPLNASSPQAFYRFRQFIPYH
jgi:hypothetical protein